MATTERIPAEVFPPGEFIREELDARGWTQSDLAEIMDRDTALVSALVTGTRSISPKTARGLGAAFGTGASFWMNLEAAYMLSRIDKDDSISRRALIYSKAPIQHMIRRGWITAKTNKVADLEDQYLKFYGLSDVNEKPGLLAHAARKSTDYNSVTQEELAWLYRAHHIATLIDCPRFSAVRLRAATEKLREFLGAPEEIRRIPGILREAGVRFVVVEDLPKTRIDGACFWLRATAPVVAVSLRYDRIDWFWHTLMHELTHVRERDGQDSAIVDTEMDQSGSDSKKPAEERRADREAAAFLVPQPALRDFIIRVDPFFSKVKIRGFAAGMRIHPGLVVGQLQYRGAISYAHNREMLVKVRNIITRTAITDGWGDVAPS